MPMSSISIRSFMKQIWVECPRCHSKAIATANKLTCDNCGFSRKQQPPNIRAELTCTYCYAKLQEKLSEDSYANKVLACSSCGHIRPTRCNQCGNSLEKKIVFAIGAKIKHVKLLCPVCQHNNQREIIWSMGISNRPYDPYFGEPLWLQMNCFNKILWAYNADHLAFIKKYVASQLRENSTVNNSLISRLPAWIKQAKNRTRLLKTIEKLENK